MIAVEFPRTQHALSKPEEWNASWERLCSSGLFPPQTCLDIDIQTFQREPDRKVYAYSLHLQRTVILRFEIGREGVDALLNENLESNWLAATAAIRRQHALVGLSEASAIAKNLNETRRLTGDILTLDNLSKDGRVLIDLLKTIIPNDISVVPETPCHFPNPTWDSFREARQKSGTEHEKLSFLKKPRPTVTVNMNTKSRRSKTESVGGKFVHTLPQTRR